MAVPGSEPRDPIIPPCVPGCTGVVPEVVVQGGYRGAYMVGGCTLVRLASDTSYQGWCWLIAVSWLALAGIPGWCTSSLPGTRGHLRQVSHRTRTQTDPGTELYVSYSVHGAAPRSHLTDYVSSKLAKLSTFRQ